MAAVAAIVDIVIKLFLAMLNSNVAPMPYIMFQLNPTYYSAADEI